MSFTRLAVLALVTLTIVHGANAFATDDPPIRCYGVSGKITGQQSEDPHGYPTRFLGSYWLNLKGGPLLAGQIQGEVTDYLLTESGELAYDKLGSPIPIGVYYYATTGWRQGVIKARGEIVIPEPLPETESSSPASYKQELTIRIRLSSGSLVRLWGGRWLNFTEDSTFIATGEMDLSNYPVTEVFTISEGTVCAEIW